jgi:hypothetical protein
LIIIYSQNSYISPWHHLIIWKTIICNIWNLLYLVEYKKKMAMILLVIYSTVYRKEISCQDIEPRVLHIVLHHPSSISSPLVWERENGSPGNLYTATDFLSIDSYKCFGCMINDFYNNHICPFSYFR